MSAARASANGRWFKIGLGIATATLAALNALQWAHAYEDCQHDKKVVMERLGQCHTSLENCMRDSKQDP